MSTAKVHQRLHLSGAEEVLPVTEPRDTSAGSGYQTGSSEPLQAITSLPSADEGATAADIVHAKARNLRECADLIEQYGEVLSIVRSLDALKLDERVQIHHVAEAIAASRYALPLDRLGREARAECEFGATYAIRRPHRAWHAEACRSAQSAIEAALVFEMGREFAEMPEAKRQALAIVVRQCAMAAFTGVLEGCGQVSNATYLRIQAAITEGEAQ